MFHYYTLICRFVRFVASTVWSWQIAVPCLCYCLCVSYPQTFPRKTEVGMTARKVFPVVGLFLSILMGFCNPSAVKCALCAPELLFCIWWIHPRKLINFNGIVAFNKRSAAWIRIAFSRLKIYAASISKDAP